jgi:ABC-2 type transport system permease protein
MSRLELWLAAVAAYGAVWFAIALLVASRVRGSANNATALTSTWLMLVIIVPAVFNLAAQTLCPSREAAQGSPASSVRGL